ncbi:SCO family protein [Balneolaceae bacterium YR4-1]|uniref:SCO family protein n=1 Tax=Halalkalibaculum roseum TaxID=2709311 RepID=A0A6M1T5D2_9BACT|nr:SCO family protein [Halalkalibaculum roseum]NGP75543.1 SCO family protein [Halalkalibaculum roseum]
MPVSLNFVAKQLNNIIVPAALSILLLTTACNSPEVINDLSDDSFALVNQDSTSIAFPKDFRGDILVVGFIYTHCPDVCPIITAKLSNINRELENSEGVHFAEISFDPARDTPSVLKKYMQSFNLDPEKFTMLTGDSVTVDSALNKMDILAKISYVKNSEEGQQSYLMNHTNRILVMDQQGRVRFEYPGSVVPEKNVIEDINRLR